MAEYSPLDSIAAESELFPPSENTGEKLRTHSLLRETVFDIGGEVLDIASEISPFRRQGEDISVRSFSAPGSTATLK